MLCLMRREGRGVLHLGKYSPPKEILFGGKRREKGKKKREKEKERKKKDNGNEREPTVL